MDMLFRPRRGLAASVRRLCALLIALSGVAVSSRAQATNEEGWDGFIPPFLTVLGALPGAVPLLATLSKEPGYGTCGMALGVGQRATALAVGFDLGGYPRRDSRLGFMGRSRFDAYGKAGLMGYRIDSLSLLSLAGNPRGPLTLEGIGGLTVAPHWVSGSAFKTMKAGVGPAAGVRVRAAAERPWLDAELELLYTPLFGAPLSERVHHASATSALGIAPGGEAWEMLTFELRGRVEWAWGGDGVEGGRPDASLMIGIRVHSSRSDKAPEAHGAGQAVKRRK